MLSSSEVRNHFTKLIRMGQMNGMTMEFGYLGKIYQLDIRPTGKDYERTWSGQYKPQIKPVTIITTTCPSCRGLFAAGVCTNKTCETNKKDT